MPEDVGLPRGGKARARHFAARGKSVFGQSARLWQTRQVLPQVFVKRVGATAAPQSRQRRRTGRRAEVGPCQLGDGACFVQAALRDSDVEILRQRTLYQAVEHGIAPLPPPNGNVGAAVRGLVLAEMLGQTDAAVGGNIDIAASTKQKGGAERGGKQFGFKRGHGRFPFGYRGGRLNRFQTAFQLEKRARRGSAYCIMRATLAWAL